MPAEDESGEPFTGDCPDFRSEEKIRTLENALFAAKRGLSSSAKGTGTFFGLEACTKAMALRTEK